MNFLPLDIQNIIYNYKEQLETHDKKKLVIAEINNMIRYDVKICRICRDVCTIYNYDETYNHYCNHEYFLTKSFYLTEDNKKIIRSDVFNFYCTICDKYEFFFSHLSHI